MKYSLFKRSKKGQMQNLAGLAIGLCTFLVLIAVGFMIMAQTKTQTHTAYGGDRNGCNTTTSIGCDNGENASFTLIQAAATIPSWTGIIVIVSIGAIILGMLRMFGGQ